MTNQLSPPDEQKMPKRRLFVAGATGAVGQTLLPLAALRKVDVLAHARPRSAGKLADVPLAVLELSEPKLVDVLRGCTTVVQLIGTMRKRFASGDTYESSDIGTTRHLLDAAKACGTVDHFILLSAVGAGSPHGAYFRAKAEAERLVSQSGIPWTTFRPSTFEDRPGTFAPGLRALTRALGLRKYQPIRLAELANAILLSAAERAPLGVALEGSSLWEWVERARG